MELSLTVSGYIFLPTSHILKKKLHYNFQGKSPRGELSNRNSRRVNPPSGGTLWQGYLRGWVNPPEEILHGEENSSWEKYPGGNPLRGKLSTTKSQHNSWNLKRYGVAPLYFSEMPIHHNPESEIQSLGICRFRKISLRLMIWGSYHILVVPLR